MKKILGILLIMVIVLAISLGCTARISDGANKDGDTADSGGSITDGSGNVDETVPTPSGEVLQEEITKVYLTINSNKLEMTLAKNSSVDALVERLKKGDITYTANDYGGFEKVGGVGFDLPTDDTRITAQAGDVMLYLGNQIVLFYGNNTWSYTRLGRIEGYSALQLRLLFGDGSVKVTLSIN